MEHSDFRGRFIWHELFCSDTSDAIAFYTRALQWKAQPFGTDSGYTLFTSLAGRPLAGCMLLPDDARAMGTAPHWRSYIGVEDVDATVARASRHGARVLLPAQDIPTVGRVAMLADPEGARFGLYRPLDPSGGGAAGDSGFAWCELAARARETALAFYQELFGWELRKPLDMGGGFYYQTFGLGGQDFGGAYSIRADRPMPPSWCPYATSISADDVAGRVTAAGGQICHGPVDVPGGGRILQFFDPQRALFAVHSMAPAAVRPAAAPAARSSGKPASAKPARKPARKPASKAPRKAPKKAPRKAARKAAARSAAKRGARPAAAKRRAPKRPARKKTSARKPARRKTARRKK